MIAQNYSLLGIISQAGVKQALLMITFFRFPRNPCPPILIIRIKIRRSIFFQRFCIKARPGKELTGACPGKAQIPILDHRDGTGAITKSFFSLNNREIASAKPLCIDMAE
jgi:hypothetical protein